MQKLVIITVFTLHTCVAYNQVGSNGGFTHKSSIQLEIGGHAIFYSINYERILINGSKFKTASQTGISIRPFEALLIPLNINEILSLNKHHIEAGIGFTINIMKEDEATVNNSNDGVLSGLLTGRLGYRFQKPDGHFVFRMALTPFIDFEAFQPVIYPFIGVSFGYSF